MGETSPGPHRIHEHDKKHRSTSTLTCSPKYSDHWFHAAVSNLVCPHSVFANSLRVSEVNAGVGGVLVGFSDPPCGNSERHFSECGVDNGLGSQCKRVVIEVH